MAKKNPNSPEWLARCVDAAVAFSDGSKMRDPNDQFSSWDMYVTIPRFFGMGTASTEWNKNTRELLNTIGTPLLDSNRAKSGRVQYHVSGKESFMDFEDTILKLYDTEIMDEMTGGIANKWKKMLETHRPTIEVPIDLSEIEQIHDIIESKRETLSSAITEAWDKVYNPASEPSSYLPVLINIAALTTDTELNSLCKSAADKISEYRNTIRVKEENWLTKAMTPIAAPFAVMAIKTDKDGKTPEFKSREEYSEALLKRMFSDDAGKIRAQLESVGVLSSKVFPVSSFKTNAVEPKVFVKDNEISVNFSWIHQRFNWALTNNILNHLEKDFTAGIMDSRKANRQKFPDPFGLETLNTQRAVIKLSDPGEAASIGEKLKNMLAVFYSPEKPEEIISKDYAYAIAEESDLIKQRVEDIKAEREARSSSLIIEDRIVPYPSKCAIYVQLTDSNNVPAISAAIDETIKKHPEWHKGNVALNRDYASIHINSEHTKEGAGFAERYKVAETLKEEIAKATGKEFPVKYPNTGFNIEVSVRRMNAQDKTDETAGIFVKIPLAMVQGGRLEEEVLNDPDVIEKYDSISRGLYDLGESFGKNSGSKNMLRLFTPKSSQMETYTTTWAYKFKEDDDQFAKLKELKGILENKISDLFGDNTSYIHLDWLPDREARKLKAYNKQIQDFSKNWNNLPIYSENTRVFQDLSL